MYRKEAAEYDAGYVKGYNDNLNILLILVRSLHPLSVPHLTRLQAGLLSAVSSAFIIDAHSRLIPNPNVGDWGSYYDHFIVATALMYASLLLSLIAAFIAMLVKQWLNWYLWNASELMIERCRARQRRCDGLKGWQFHLVVEILPVMLQASPILLALGICMNMWPINPYIAYVPTTITFTGLVAYIWSTMAGILSDTCPYQTSLSIGLRSLLKLVQRGIVPAVFKQVFLRPNQGIPPVRDPQLLQIPLDGLQVQQHQQGDLQVQPCGQDNLQVQPHGQELVLDVPVATKEAHNSDVCCLLWILQNVIDPEALDIAIRFAATIRWPGTGPPHHLIVSTLMDCFDSTGMLYCWSGDKAYYSAQAILWIYARAVCMSEELAPSFTLPDIRCSTKSLDPNLTHLIGIYACQTTSEIVSQLCHITPGSTPLYFQWASDVLLHLSWANQRVPDTFNSITKYYTRGDWSTIPWNAVLNHLLTWCIFLGWPIHKSVLEIQDKLCVIFVFILQAAHTVVLSNHTEQIVFQLSQAVMSAICTSHPRCDLLPHMLADLAGWEQRPSCLTTMAYELCSAILENYSSLMDGRQLLFLSLQIGFRHLDPQHPQIQAKLTHTEHHNQMADIVFENGGDEVIADLLQAWASSSDSHQPLQKLSMCTRHLAGCQPPPGRLRRLLIRVIELTGPWESMEVGAGQFSDLLNYLQVGVEDMDEKGLWVKLLMDTIQHHGGAQILYYPYWELLVELLVSGSLQGGIALDPDIMTNLESDQQWDKLECWMGVIWMVWSPEVSSTTEEHIRGAMLSLFHCQAGAVQKLEQWMGQWSVKQKKAVPKTFQQICNQQVCP